MPTQPSTDLTLRAENAELRVRLEEAEQMLRAIRASALHGPDGAGTGYVASIRDITERHQAEAALRQNTTMFSKIIEQAPGGVYVVDAQFRVVQMNTQSLLFFASAQPLIGRDFDEVLEIVWGPEIGPQIASIFRDTLVTGERYISPRFSEQRQDLGVEQAFEWETQRITLPDGQHGVVCYFQDVTARERAEAALRLTSERLNLAVKCSQVVLFQQDLELRYTWLQNAVPGFEELVAIGKRDADRMERAEDAAVTEALKREVIRSGVGQRQEVLVQVQGVGRHYDLLVEPQRDAAGLISGVTGAAIDITERKRAEAALHESERHFRALAVASSEVAYRMSADWSTMLPLDGRQLVSSSDQPLADWAWLDLYIPPDEHPRVRQAISEVIARKTLFELEHRVRRPDGSIGWTLSRAVPILDKNEAVIAWFGAASDVTARKRTEEALRESEANAQARTAELESLLASAPLGMAYFDRQHRYVRINDEHAEINGIPAAAHIGKTIEELLPKNAETVTPVLNRIFETGEVVSALEVTGETPREPGVVRHWLTGFFPVRDGRGEVASIGAWVIEISERKRAEEALRDSEGQLRINDDRLNLLHDITVNPTLGNAARLQSLLRFGCEQFDLESGVVGEVSGDTYKVALAISPGNSIPVGFSSPVKDALCDEVLKRNDLLAIENVGRGEWRGHQAHSVFGTEVYFGVPINVDGRVFGTLCFTSPKPRETAFTRGDREFLRLLANTVGAEMTRQHFTEQLRVNEERLSLAMTGANVGSFDWNIKTGGIEWSDEIIKATGYSTEDFDKSLEGFKKLIHPLDRERVAGCLAVAMKEGIYEFEFRMLKADGSIRWAIGKGRVYFDDEGNPARLVGVDIDITKRKFAEEQLKLAAERNEIAQEAARASLYEFIPHTDQAIRNESFASVLGYAADEVPLTSEAWINLIHPDDLPESLEIFGKGIESNEGFTHEYRVRHKDGHYIWLYDRARAIRGEQGKVERIVGMIIDITTRKQAEDRLSQSEGRFRAAVGAVSSLIWTNNPSGEMEGEQPGWGKFTGQSQEEYQGYGWARAVHPDDAQPTIDGWNQALAEKRIFEGEHRVRRSDGEWRLCGVRAAPVLGETGEIREWVGVHTDITERKQAEQALADRTELLNGVLEGTTDVIFVKDLNGRLLLVNTACAAIVRSTPEQLVGKTTEELFPPDEGAVIRQHDEAVIAGGSAIHLEETIPVAGEARSFLTLKAPLRDSSGRVVGILAISRDITERKRIEFSLIHAVAVAEKANRAKSDFLSSMSHELRTPLNAILGFAQLMVSSTPAPTPAQKRSLDQIIKGGWYLLDLINELLNLALIESGKVSLTLEPVSLAELMLECQAMVEPQARERGIDVTFPSFEFAESVHADRIRVKQVVINLLSNAIKYNKAQGAVAVEWTLIPPDAIRISVRDTGEGLAPEKLAQLFQPFNRLGQEAGPLAGTGIGLAMAKQLVELMGGAIGVDSVVGVGSAFWFELKRASAPQFALLQAEGPAQAPSNGVVAENGI